MSEGGHTSATESLVLAEPDERNGMYAGTVVIVLAVVALAISVYQSSITAPLFGPTLAPRLMALAMVAMGVALITDKLKVRNPQDFYGGIALIGLAIVALLASNNLAGMRGFAFGPATSPRLFAVLLGILGGVVAITGLQTQGGNLERYDVRAPTLWSIAYYLFHYTTGIVWPAIAIVLALLGVVIAFFGLRNKETHISVRGPVALILAVLLFAETIRPLGLIAASFLTIMAAAGASPEVNWKESAIWGVILTGFCSLLFPYALGLPFLLMPTFMY